MTAHWLPKDRPILQTCLSVQDAAKLRDFIVQVFDVPVHECHTDPSGVLRHAEVKFGAATQQLAGAWVAADAGQGSAQPPANRRDNGRRDSAPLSNPRDRRRRLLRQAARRSTCTCRTATRHSAARSKPARRPSCPPTTQFYGDRHGTLRDAWGNLWSIATHVEDVSDEEMARRTQEFMAKESAQP